MAKSAFEHLDLKSPITDIISELVECEAKLRLDDAQKVVIEVADRLQKVQESLLDWKD